MKSGNKKISFIYPSYYKENGIIAKTNRVWMPGRSLPYLAALTPKRFDVEIIEERVEGLRSSQNNDLIALTGMINNIPRAIDIAKKYKNDGKAVIIGGPGAFSLQHELEVMDCFDSIVIGEAETVWGDILNDFDSGTLKKKYTGQHLQELKGLPFARFDLLNPKHYRKAITDPRLFPVAIETSRGCPHNCEFCLVNKIFGRHICYRPISEVVDEIKYQKGNYIFFTDDNIAVNPDRAKELFKALKSLDIHWFGQFDTTVINNPEIIKLAGECGCWSALIGIESLNKDNLVSMQKMHNVDIQVNELIQYFKQANINVLCSVMFGMDHDTPKSILETAYYMIENKVEMMVPWMLTPFPGTHLHEDCKSKGLILHNNYSLYDGLHCIIRPIRMKPDELEKAFWHAFRKCYSLKAMILRSLHRGDIMNSFRIFLRELYIKSKVNRRSHPFLA